MFNRTSGAGGRRSAHFFLGVLAGAAVVGAYAISCDGTSPVKSGTTGGTSGTMVVPAAGDVSYANAQSGLGSTTVQAAIDEIGTTMRSATVGGSVVTGGARSTTWNMETRRLDPATDTLASTGMGTLTVTETAPGQGSYETSGPNILILDGIAGAPQGTRTGRYFIVGDLVLVTGEPSPGFKSGYTWLARLADGGRTLALSNFGGVLLVLTRQ